MLRFAETAAAALMLVMDALQVQVRRVDGKCSRILTLYPPDALMSTRTGSLEVSRLSISLSHSSALLSSRSPSHSFSLPVSLSPSVSLSLSPSLLKRCQTSLVKEVLKQVYSCIHYNLTLTP